MLTKDVIFSVLSVCLSACSFVHYRLTVGTRDLKFGTCTVIISGKGHGSRQKGQGQPYRFVGSATGGRF